VIVCKEKDKKEGKTWTDEVRKMHEDVVCSSEQAINLLELDKSKQLQKKAEFFKVIDEEVTEQHAGDMHLIYAEENQDSQANDVNVSEFFSETEDEDRS
jgi:hypothetical protein